MSLQQAWIEALERDASLNEPARLRERAEVLDRLETHVPLAFDAASAETGLQLRAMALRARLEAINHRLYAELREELRCGSATGRLLQWAAERGRLDIDGYDHLDDLLAGVLPFDAPEDVPDPPAEMVFYQPTPARHIFDLIRRTSLGADDVLLDLGSGLGHVPVMIALCTQARAIGIEREAAYIARARQCADALNLGRVEFIQQDARAADFSAGTVFYLYTPFSGSILRSVLGRLQHEASQRAIRVCTYGPCTQAIANEPWLAAAEPVEAGRVAVFHSRNTDTREMR